MTMAYAVGHISGGHFNPAVSLGLMIAGRFESKELLPYWVAQTLGAILAAIVLTGFFLIIILGATSKGAPAGFAPIAIGLGLTLIHLVSIPVTNTSVNPARSTGVALFADGPALAQLWLFWVAPLLGAALGASLWKLMSTTDD